MKIGLTGQHELNVIHSGNKDASFWRCMIV